MGAEPSPVILYLSERCKFCNRALARLRDLPRELLENVRCYRVDDARRADLPAFVDRVPLMVVGTTILTDQALFDALDDAVRPATRASPQSRSRAHEEEREQIGRSIEPAGGLGRDSFGASRFVTLDGSLDGDAIRSDAAWDISAPHEPIPTPDSEPMPSQSAPECSPTRE